EPSTEFFFSICLLDHELLAPTDPTGLRDPCRALRDRRVRRRFNGAVLEAVYIKDRRIGRAEFSEVFAPLFSRPSSNKALKVDPRGFEPLTFWLPARRSTS